MTGIESQGFFIEDVVICDKRKKIDFIFIGDILLNGKTKSRRKLTEIENADRDISSGNLPDLDALQQ